ncbi:transcriptional regulator, AsnC family, partial [mine drainage metagenome]
HYLGRIFEDGSFKEARRRFKKKESMALLNYLPQAVREALKPMEEKYGSIGVIPSKSLYHVYNTTSYNTPSYLGYIDTDGKFTPFSSITSIHEEPKEYKIDKIDFTILRALSMNARMPLKRIAKFSGLKHTAVHHRIKKLEINMGISYIAEIDVEKLGYTEYMLFIKFRGNRPKREEAISVFANDPRVQFTAITEGEYQIMAYALAKNNKNASDLMFKLMGGAMSGLDAEWYLVPFKGFYGYAPLRDEFFNLIEQNDVWQRSKDNMKKPPNVLGIEEYTVLRDLNTNGKAEFKEISGRYKLKAQSANYYYKRLIDKKIIKRITITMQKLPTKYFTVMIASIINDERFRKTRTDLLFEVIKESNNYTNRYSLFGDIQNPSGVIFIAPILKDAEAESIEEEIVTRIKGIEIKRIVVTDIIVGRLCLRNFDNAHSVQHEMLEEQDLIETEQKKLYSNY